MTTHFAKKKPFNSRDGLNGLSIILIVLISIILSNFMTGCATVQPTRQQAKTIVTAQQQHITGHLAYILQQGRGKNQINSLVVSQLDGSDAKIVTQVVGTLFSLSASRDGNTLIFTEQKNSFPAIFTYDLNTHQKTTITPQRANHFSANISPDSQKLLISSSLNQNPEIFLADKDGSNLQQLTHNQSADIAPFWSPDQQWFIFTSDRTAIYHPQLYRYDFATAKTSRVATTGGYNSNAKISPKGDFISYITKSSQGRILRVLNRLNDGKTWAVGDDDLAESMSFSSDGQFLVFSKKSAIEIASLPTSDNDWQFRPVYRLSLDNIALSSKDLSNATIREPILIP